MAVRSDNRFKNSSSACPICGGWDSMHRGAGQRCGGFLSDDGKYAHCTREDRSGGIQMDGAQTFSHYLNGQCKCGVTHQAQVIDSKQSWKLTAIYPYSDEKNTLLYEVLRYISPSGEKTFKQRRPAQPGDDPSKIKNGFIWNLEGVRRVLYGLSELLTADPNEPVFITEGEKDADRCTKEGLIATCNSGGAEKWRAEYGPNFIGRDVVILPDNDEPGYKHADQILTNIYPYARTVKVLTLEGLPPKGDVSNWFDNGHTSQELLSLAMQADTASPKSDDNTSTPDQEPPKEKVKRLWHVDELGQFPKPVWLIQDELQRNSLAFLIGESGSGKSFYAIHDSLIIAQTETVIYIAGEGASGYKQRIDAWREYYRPEACHMYLWPSPLPLIDPISRAEFIKEIQELKPALIVNDTLARSAVGLDENSAKDMGLIIAACDEIRIATGACVLVVHHTGKNGASERGSSALRGAADTMLKVVEEAELRKIVYDKQKDAPEIEPRYIKLLPIGESLVVVEASKNDSISSGKVKGKVKEVLEAMAGEIFIDTGATWKRLIEVLNWENSSGRKAEMFKILNHLKKSGYIRQAERGEPYYITPAGLDVVSIQEL